MSNRHSECHCVAKTAEPIIEVIAWDDDRQNDSQHNGDGEEMTVLELKEFVLLQIGDIGRTGMEGGGEEHPANVGPQEPSVSVVRILVGIDVSVVRAMGPCPPERGALERGGSTPYEEELEGKACVVRPVRP